MIVSLQNPSSPLAGPQRRNSDTQGLLTIAANMTMSSWAKGGLILARTKILNIEVTRAQHRPNAVAMATHAP